jgi:Tfp pilus assembly protein PilN
MKRITPIDFVAPRRAAGIGRALLALAAAGLAWQGGLAWNAQQSLAQQAESFAVAMRQAAAPQRTAAPLQQRAQAQIEHLSRHLAAPWDQLMDLFEKHGNGDIALVRLEPDATTGVVSVTARARHRRIMLAYVMALENDKRLSSVLLNHYETLHDVDGAPVQFSVHAVWRPAVAAALAKGGAQEAAQ